MGVQHRILTRETSIPKKTDTDRRHIRFLAASRNLVMKPLSELADQGRLFDRILWSNDVFVHAESIVELLETHDMYATMPRRLRHKADTVAGITTWHVVSTLISLGP